MALGVWCFCCCADCAPVSATVRACACRREPCRRLKPKPGAMPAGGAGARPEPVDPKELFISRITKTLQQKLQAQFGRIRGTRVAPCSAPA
jgi:hypothetical protein